ncbi:hypothetical protein KI387_011936, partial [Taxus chinensis]
MLDCRSLFLYNADWRLGKGKKSLFWDDPWNGFPTLVDIPEFEGIKERLLDEWGPFVSIYGLMADPLPSVLQWKNLDHLGLSDELKKNFMSALALQERQVLIYNKQDEIVWTAASSGSYSPHLGYLLLHEAVAIENSIWKDCWESPCPSKVGLFAWMAFQ